MYNEENNNPMNNQPNLNQGLNPSPVPNPNPAPVPNMGAPIPNQNINNSQDFGFNQGGMTPAPSKYKLTLNRKKDFVGSLVAAKVIIDNENVGKLKNGTTMTFEVTPGVHTISFGGNASEIQITGDTTYEVGFVAANTFGIIGTGGNVDANVTTSTIEKSTKATNALFWITIILSAISLILIFFVGYYIKFWYFAICIGDAIVNLSGLKKLGVSEETKKLRTKNIIAIVVAIVMILITAFILVEYGN